MAIVAACNFGMNERKVSPVQTCQQEYQDLYGHKKEGKKLRQQHMDELLQDSLNRVQEDSAYLAQYIMIASSYKDENGKTHNLWFHAPTEEERAIVTEYDGLEKSWKGLVALLLILLPIIYGTLRVVFSFAKVGRQRKQISDENAARQANYEHALYMFNEGRPSIADYVLFCGCGKVFNMDFRPLIEQHERNAYPVTLAYTKVEKGEVLVLADTVERPEEIDENKVYENDEIERRHILIKERDRHFVEELFKVMPLDQKAIVFCVSQKHARRIARLINEEAQKRGLWNASQEMQESLVKLYLEVEGEMEERADA